jgi:hypothetical protein
MSTYFSLRDGLITDSSTYGMSISSVEKTTNTTAYTLTTSDSWSTLLSGSTTDVIHSIAVHLNSRAADPIGVLSAEASQYAGVLTKVGTTLSATSPFTAGETSSIYFPGTTNNYLRAPELPFGSNNFTVELWAYFTTSTAQQHIIGQWGTGGTGYSWSIYTSNDANRFLRFLVSSNGSAGLFDRVTTTQIPLNTWVHIALTRDTGGVYRIFLNGTLCGNGSITNSTALFNATSDLTIGASNQGISLFAGYMSNIRIVNGTALYTSSPFTPSASPLTPVTNTAFLYQAPYTNAYKNSSSLNTLVGTYPISSFTSYDGSNNFTSTYPLNWQLLKLSAPFTNSSGYFNLNLKTSDADQLSLMGASTVNGVDYDRMAVLSGINVPQLVGTTTLVGSPFLSSASPFGVGVDSSIQTLSSGTSLPYVNFNTTLAATRGAIFERNDFTIEMFVNYSTLIGNSDVLFLNYTTTFTTGSIFFGRHPSYSGRVAFFAYDINPSAALLIDPNPVNTGEWIHYAVVRSGNRFDLYRNGVSVANTTRTGSVNSVYPLAGFAGWFRPTNACVSNYRIVNGTAVYKSNFTVPTAPLSNILNTTVLYKAPYNTTFLYADPVINLHIGGSLSELSTEARTITADSFKLNNLYVHNQGKITFPLTDTNISIEGSEGLQITSEGTVEIGTSANNVPLIATHRLLMSNNSIDIHNGGILNVFGYPTQPYTSLVNDVNAGQNTFTVTEEISSTWKSGDRLLIIPNTTTKLNFDSLTLGGFTNYNTLNTNSASLFSHLGVTNNPYVPSIYNTTRNVILTAINNTTFSIRAIGKAKVSINNSSIGRLNLDAIKSVLDSDGGELHVDSSVITSHQTRDLLTSDDPISFSGRFESRQFATTTSNATNIQNTDATLEFNLLHVGGTTGRICGKQVVSTSGHASVSYLIDVISGDRIQFTWYKQQAGRINESSVGGTLITKRLKLNVWNNIVLTHKYSTNTAKLYLNGKLNAQANVSGWWLRTDVYLPETGVQWKQPTFTVGCAGRQTLTGVVYDQSYNGSQSYINNLRITKSVLYTSDFQPTFQRLTVVPNTKLLVFQNELIRDVSNTCTINPNTFIAYNVNPNRNFTNITFEKNIIVGSLYTGLFFSGARFNKTRVTDNIILSANLYGFGLFDSFGEYVLSGNKAISCKSGGIETNEDSVAFTSSANTIYNCLGNGFSINSAEDCILDNNITAYNQGIGLYINDISEDPYTSAITNLSSLYNRNDGIYANTPTGNLIITNVKSLSNTGNGLFGRLGYSFVLSAVESTFNSKDGVSLSGISGVTNAQMCDINITNNMAYGLRLSADLSSYYSLTADNITTVGNGMDGFTAQTGDNCILTDITSLSNRANGLYLSLIENSQCVLTNITSLSNQSNGIYLSLTENSQCVLTNITSLSNQSNGIYLSLTENSQVTDRFSFTNVTASNNGDLGFCIYGNSLYYLNPITLNVNQLVTNNNNSLGVEAYNITGNLSSIETNCGISTSIGNGITVFDKINSNTILVPTSNAYTVTGAVTATSLSPFTSTTEGSLSASGNTGYISFPTTSRLLFGANEPFTLEAWTFLRANNTLRSTIVGQYDVWASDVNYVFAINSTGFPTFFVNSSTNTFTSSLPVTLNRWNHIAVSRTTNAIYMFLNGVMSASSTSAGFFGAVTNTANVTTLFAQRDNTDRLSGLISNARLVVGTALYRTNFTPVTSTPLRIYGNQTAFLFNDPYNGTYRSTSPGANVNAFSILSGNSYSDVIIKNSILTPALNVDESAAALILDSTKFSKFFIENCTLSSTTSIEVRATNGLVEGSYLINNTDVGSLPLGVGISTLNYQTDVFKSAGFAFTNIDKLTGSNVAYFAAGSRISDYTITYNVGETASPSERLTPQSPTIKLRSGSKFVALNQGEFATISVFARSSRQDINGVAYNGNPPRLMLKRNASMGIDEDVVLARLYSLSNAFSKLEGVTPVVTDNGVLEFYVDCDGTQGWINIDNWGAK